MLEYIGEIFHHFVDPKKRVFLGYIALSVAIALFWLVFFKKKGLKSAIFKVFDKKILLSGSAISDYKMFLINRVLMLVLSPYLLTQLAVATFFYYSLLSLPLSGLLSFLNDTPTIVVAIIFTIPAILTGIVRQESSTLSGECNLSSSSTTASSSTK